MSGEKRWNAVTFSRQNQKRIREEIVMTEPMDDSRSPHALDEATLLPLAMSAGALADDPDLDTEGDHEPYAEGIPDDAPTGPGEEPGRPLTPLGGE
jgi:hypothetical protein